MASSRSKDGEAEGAAERDQGQGAVVPPGTHLFVLTRDDNRWHPAVVLKASSSSSNASPSRRGMVNVKFAGYSSAWNQWVDVAFTRAMTADEIEKISARFDGKEDIDKAEEPLAMTRNRLLSAVSAGNDAEIREVFRLKGAAWVNRHVVDKDGWTPAHYAARNLQPQALETLWELGACVCQQSTTESNDVQAGSTPLHMLCKVKSGASEEEKARCIRFLTGFGHGFILVPNAAGQSCADLVKRQRKPLVRDLLAAALADPALARTAPLVCNHRGGAAASSPTGASAASAVVIPASAAAAAASSSSSAAAAAAAATAASSVSGRRTSPLKRMRDRGSDASPTRGAAHPPAKRRRVPTRTSCFVLYCPPGGGGGGAEVEQALPVKDRPAAIGASFSAPRAAAAAQTKRRKQRKEQQQQRGRGKRPSSRIPVVTE